MFLIGACVLLLLLLYFYLTKNYGYWKQRNVKHDAPVVLFGNNFRNFMGLISWANLSIMLYNKYPKEKVVGYYRGMIPELHIRDLDIAKQILNNDFSYFYARGLGRDPTVDPTMLNIFHAEGDSWKLLRQRLTPAFTSGKLKAMFPLIVSCAQKLQTLTEELADNHREYDVRELMARFTTEFIGACGFGIEMDAISDEQSQFRDLGRKIFDNASLPTVRFWTVLNDLFPTLTKYKLLMDPNVITSINDIFKEIRKQRNCKPSGRNDFVDLLLELEAKGKLTGESIEKSNPDGSPVPVEMEITLPIMVAQIFIFFAAGFETSSSATSFTLHQLAFHPEIQTKIHKEIDEVLAKYNNTICYDAVREMKLLERTFKEGMRMFPSLPVLNRVCVKKYTIPDLNITIDPGVQIVIPLMAYQNDEQYFENPKEFNPDRFLPEKMQEVHKYCYLPFGEGPRACIGGRLGQMQSLAGLAAVLQKFQVEPSASTVRKPEVLHTSNVVQSIKGGLPLRITKRKSTL